MYRNKKILALAEGQTCQSCGAQDGTVVAAHSNQSRHGKGMGIKAHDAFVAYLCRACHYFVDFSKTASREARNALWEAAHIKSIPIFQHLLDGEGRALLGVR